MPFQHNDDESLSVDEQIEINGRSYRITGQMIQPMGTYGEVYPAVDIRSKKEYAIKIMIPDGSLLMGYDKDIDERIKAFETEHKLLHQLQGNKTVVRMFAYQSQKGTMFPVIVEELLDLSTRLSDWPMQLFSVEQAYSFSMQLFALLVFAHTKQIAYREFKSNHFFFSWREDSHRGILKIIDWNASSQGNSEDIKISNEIDWMRTFSFNNYYPHDSEMYEIIFRAKHDSAEEILMELLQFGARNNLLCPAVVPLKYKLLGLWMKIRKG